jgi:hypothetical protein
MARRNDWALEQTARQAERARIRRIVRRVADSVPLNTHDDEAYGRYVGVRSACEVILAALKETRHAR